MNPVKCQLSLLAIPLALALPVAALGAPRYHVTDLGTVSGSNENYANAINDNGEIVGGAVVGSNDHAFLWTGAGGMQDLGHLPGGADFSYGWAVNNAGTVVGQSGSPTGYHAFLQTSGGAMQDLGDLPGGASYSLAIGINDNGQVVGFGSVATGDHPFLWTSTGGMQDLGDLGGGTTQSGAYDINNSGQVVGESTVTSGDMHGFLWTSSGGMQDLGTLAGGSNSWAYSINTSGQVAGGGTTAAGGTHAIRWTSAGVAQDLGDLPGGVNYNDSAGMNNAGQVVGYAYMDAAQTISHAWLWTTGAGMMDLNNLVDPSGTGWVLQGAVGANDTGQIAGYGVNPAGATHAVLLTLVGDLNGDGVVNNFDISPFELALADSAAFLAEYPIRDDYQIRGDVNGDGVFDNFDIASFELELAGSPASAVPEPSSLLLMALGAIGLGVLRRCLDMRAPSCAPAE